MYNYNHKNKMQTFQKPDLTDDELHGLLEINTLDSFDKTLKIYKAMKIISPDQLTALENHREFIPPVLKRGGKRCRRTCRKRILNKNMKPMHKSMHRGRSGKRRSFKKY